MDKEMQVKTPTPQMREAVRKVAHEMRIMDGRGDTKLVWDAENEDETLAAQETFEKLRKKGFRAYAVGRRGQRIGDPIDEFNPDVEKLILAPAMAGG
jgi:hypothetical protein